MNASRNAIPCLQKRKIPDIKVCAKEAVKKPLAFLVMSAIPDHQRRVLSPHGVTIQLYSEG